MTPTEKAIRDFCGHHADWWPSTTQVQEMLALAQPEQKPMHSELRKMWEDYFDKCFAESAPQRTWVGLTKDEVEILAYKAEGNTWIAVELTETKLKEKNNG